MDAGCALNADVYDLCDVERIQYQLNSVEPETWRIVVVGELYEVLYRGPDAEHDVVVQLASGHARLVKDLKRQFSVCLILVPKNQSVSFLA